MGVLSGCVREPWRGGTVDDGAGESGVSLNLAPARVQGRAVTRAGALDFDRMDDINIAVVSGAGDGAAINSVIWVDLASAVDGQALDPSGHVTYHLRTTGERAVHFDEEWFEAMGLDGGTVRFFVVVNRGSDISAEAQTVGQLRELKDHGTPHMMFGESVEFSNPAHTHTGGRSLLVELRRTAAMVTVKVDGTNLKPQLSIRPIALRLHNVPAWCYIGQRNVITQSDGITPIDGGTVLANGESLALRSDPLWGEFASPVSGLGYPLPSVVGAHYTDPPGSAAAPDWSNAAIRPLVLFENWHGEGFGSYGAIEQEKRPAAAVGIPPELLDGYTRACSYLELEAEYHDYQGPVQQHGTVRWRIFLGANITDNFDVERNTYYRLTLNLRNGAIDEHDWSWRVETNLGQVEITESDYLLNATAYMITDLDLKTDNTNFKCDIVASEPAWNAADPWIWVPNDRQWVGLGGNLELRPVGGTMDYRLWMFVEPMMRPEWWNAVDSEGNPVTERKVVLRCYRIDDPSITTPDITIIQHEPLVRQVGSRTVYFDRVDRKAIPWGYQTYSVSQFNDAYSNTYQVLGGLLWVQGMPYLPLGRPQSALLDAALTHYYMNESNDIDFDVWLHGTYTLTPQSRPPVGQLQFALPTRSDWAWLHSLHEQQPLFDPLYPVSPSVGYWTSDPDDNNSAWIYSKSTGPISTPRSTPTNYRFIYETTR